MNFRTFLILMLVLLTIFLTFKVIGLSRKARETDFNYRSLYVKHGKNWENFAPFMKSFPGNRENFRFLGNPVDGVIFDDDEIKFVEIKTGKSNLNEKQKRIKLLVDNKKVKFYELRF